METSSESSTSENKLRIWLSYNIYSSSCVRVSLHCCLAEPVPLPKCMAALGMQSGALHDRYISSSSDWNAAHRAANGRLHFQAGHGRTGAWSARHNNVHQWLQIGGKWMKITRISTQGRQDANQWVKSYTLSYSYDGVWWYKYAKVFSEERSIE